VLGKEFHFCDGGLKDVCSGFNRILRERGSGGDCAKCGKRF